MFHSNVDHTATALSLWMGAAYQAHPERLAGLPLDVATAGLMSQTLVSHALSEREALASLTWSYHDPHALYLAFSRYREVLFGTQTAIAALGLCPDTLARETPALCRTMETYVGAMPRLGWKFGVARLVAWQALGVLPLSDIVRRTESRADRLSPATRSLMLEAGFHGRDFNDFFDGGIPSSSAVGEGSSRHRVSLTHALYHAMAHVVGPLTFPRAFDAATIAETHLVANELAHLIDGDLIQLAALRTHLGDEGLTNWLDHEMFEAPPLDAYRKRWAWITQTPPLPIGFDS